MREFRLAVRGDRLWHVRVGAGGDQVRVPRGARLVFGHANRHDTLSLASDDREADLIVLGEVIRRPFFARSRYDIGAGILERGFARRDEERRPVAKASLRGRPRDAATSLSEMHARRGGTGPYDFAISPARRQGGRD